MNAQTIAMIPIILQVIIVSMYGLLLALLSYLLDFCFWRGNVFQFWIPFLARTIGKLFFPIKYENIMLIKDKTKRDDEMIDLANDHPLFKMLGGCAICLNVWLGFITYPLIHYFAGHSWWYMIVYTLTASFFLRKIMKVD